MLQVLGYPTPEHRKHGQNVIGFEFFSCGRRDLYRLRQKLCLLAASSRIKLALGLRYVATL